MLTDPIYLAEGGSESGSSTPWASGLLAALLIAPLRGVGSKGALLLRLAIVFAARPRSHLGLARQRVSGPASRSRSAWTRRVSRPRRHEQLSPAVDLRPCRRLLPPIHSPPVARRADRLTWQTARSITRTSLAT